MSSTAAYLKAHRSFNEESLLEWLKKQCSASKDASVLSYALSEVFNRRFDVQTATRTQELPILAMGTNESKQICDVDADPRAENYMRFTPPLKRACFVEAGNIMSMAIVEGKLFSFGGSDDGALGRPATSETEADPTQVTGFIDPKTGINEDELIVSVACGDNFTLVRTVTGNLYEFGMYKDCDSGKFHSNGKDSQKTPLFKQLPCAVDKVVAASSYVAVIGKDGNVYTWGMGNHGQLARSATMTGKEQETYDLTPNAFYKDPSTSKLNIDLVVDKFMKPDLVLYASPGMKMHAKNVACGNLHLVVVASCNGGRNLVYTSGSNSRGQLGLGQAVTEAHKLTQVTSNVSTFDQDQFYRVAAGADHTLMLSHDGQRLYGCGYNGKGQLGLGFHSDLSDSAVMWEARPIPLPQEPSLKKIQTVKSSDNVSILLTQDGSLYSTGSSSFGAVGHEVKSEGTVDIYFFKRISVPKIRDFAMNTHVLMLTDEEEESTAPDQSRKRKM